MTASEIRAGAVRVMKSIAKRNRYTNGPNREKVFDGWGDCSSTVRKVLQKAGLNVNIGSNTNAQIKNRAKLGIVVDESTNGYPNEANLKPSDCLYFRGNIFHTLRVGHVEMYTGANECYGHGSGIGPTKKNLRDYCKSRNTFRKRYFMAIRWAFDMGERILDKGKQGADVMALQKLLLKLEYILPSGADGDFGKETLAAVRAFQADAGLIVDGVMDAADLAKLADIAAHGWPKPDEPAPPPPEIPTPGETVYLVRGCFPDIGSNQGRIRDFDKFCAKTDCAIFRVVRENLEIDSEALYNMKNCAARKHPFGVYVFFKAWTDLTARTFVRKLYQNSALYDPRFYVLDIEGWYPKAAVLAAIDEARKLGIARLGVYMGSYRWRTRYKKMLAALVDFVWLANYGKNTGWLSNIPDNPCALHQYTSKGRIPGIADETCDLNRLTGNVPLSFFTGRKHSGVEYPGIVQATGNVYVRQGPGTQYKAITKIPKGRYAIKREGSTSGWQAVSYEGKDGYVSEAYVRAVSER